MTTDEPIANASADSEDGAWKRALWMGGVAYLVSRMCVVAGAVVVAAKGIADAHLSSLSVARAALRGTAMQMILDVLTSWDGQWYLRVIRDGYPRYVPAAITTDHAEARAAFFPLFPVAVRLADRLLPGGDIFAALALNFLLGGLAVLLAGILARRVVGVRRACQAMVLIAVFPGSLVLSMVYSEALLLSLAAGCLLCLQNRRWWTAGLLAALATATRANGLALVAACAVAAVLVIRERREWQALVAPVLSPLGFLAFQLWLDARLSERGIWFRVQREAWGEYSSYGLAAFQRTVSALIHPLLSKNDFVTAVTLLATILLVYVAWRQRLPWPMWAYCAGILALMLLPTTVTARPRFLFTAFPLFISFTGWWWDGPVDAEMRGGLWALLIGLCCAGIVTLTGLYGVSGAIP